MNAPTTGRMLLTVLAALSLPLVARSATPRHAPRPKAHAIKLSALPDSAAVMALLTGVSNGACPLAAESYAGFRATRRRRRSRYPPPMPA